MDLTVLITVPANAVFGVSYARTLYNDALPATVVEGQGETAITVPNPALIASNAAYIQAIISRAVESWCAQTNVAPPPPAPAPVTINGVPQEVSRRQARQALILAGKYSLVQPAINAIVNETDRSMMQSEWDDSQTFQRQRTSLITMGTAIGLTSAQLDALFVQAATL